MNPGRDIVFPFDLFDVEIRGLFADRENFADLPIALADRHPLQAFALTQRQGRGRRRMAARRGKRTNAGMGINRGQAKFGPRMRAKIGGQPRELHNRRSGAKPHDGRDIALTKAEFSSLLAHAPLRLGVVGKFQHLGPAIGLGGAQ